MSSFLSSAAAVQLLCERFEMRRAFGDRYLVVATRGDERVEPVFLVGEVRFAAPQAIHARFELFDVAAEVCLAFSELPAAFPCGANCGKPLVRVTECLLRADLVGARPNAFQIGASQELLLHTPPDFRVQLVEPVQTLLHFLDETPAFRSTVPVLLRAR